MVAARADASVWAAVSLTKTGKNVGELKANLVDSIRECVDLFRNAFLFSFENMRTSHFKDVRAEWKDSRFFLGKNKVMRVALGRDTEEEYRDGLAEFASGLSGSVGLLFTNRDKEEVLSCVPLSIAAAVCFSRALCQCCLSVPSCQWQQCAVSAWPLCCVSVASASLFSLA